MYSYIVRLTDIFFWGEGVSLSVYGRGRGSSVLGSCPTDEEVTVHTYVRLTVRYVRTEIR